LAHYRLFACDEEQSGDQGNDAYANAARACKQTMSLVNTFIVEDSPIILDNLVATLEELAPVSVVGTAPDEASAVRWLTDPAHSADLVIIDVFLKAGSGLGVLKSAANAKLPGKRVVLTNYATPDMRDKCAALGAHRVFDKSSELDELIAYCTRLGEGSVDSQPGGLP
jgi:DNA-binding NarL/FixJ family response regulator